MLVVGTEDERRLIRLWAKDLDAAGNLLAMTPPMNSPGGIQQPPATNTGQGSTAWKSRGMSIDHFGDLLLGHAHMMECPLNDEAEAMLRRLLDQYRAVWKPEAGDKESSAVRVRIRLVVQRAILICRQTGRDSIDAHAFTLACADDELGRAGEDLTGMGS